MIEEYKSYSADWFKNDKKSGSSEFFDPFVKGSPIKWGVHLYKICLIYAVLKWVLCIKFSRAIFAWKKVKCSIYVTLQKNKTEESNGCHNGSNGGWQPMWITDSREFP